MEALCAPSMCQSHFYHVEHCHAGMESVRSHPGESRVSYVGSLEHCIMLEQHSMVRLLLLTFVRTGTLARTSGIVRIWAPAGHNVSSSPDMCCRLVRVASWACLLWSYPIWD